MTRPRTSTPPSRVTIAHVTRVLRILLISATAISLLLSAVSAFFCIRSYRAHDGYPMFLTGSGTQIETWQGRLLIARFTVAQPPPHLLIRIEMANVGSTGFSYASPGRNLALIKHQTSYSDATTLTMPRITFPNASIGNAYGFGHAHYAIFGPLTAPPTSDLRAVSIPLWFTSTLFALPIIPRLRRRRMLDRRRRENRCVACGYDLRASPARCPECGNTAELAVDA